MVGCRKPTWERSRAEGRLARLRPRLSLFYGENDRETQTTCGHWGSEGSRTSGATPPLAPVFPRTDRHAEEASFALEAVGSNFKPRHYPFAGQNRVRESALAVSSLDSTADMIRQVSARHPSGCLRCGKADPREFLRCARHDVLIRSNHQALLTGHIDGYAIAIGRHEAHALASRGCLLPLHGHLGPALGTTSPRSQLVAGPLCQHQERGSCAVRNRQAAPLREPTCARTPGLGTVLPGTDIAAKQ